MQTTYRLKAEELSTTFLKSVKTLFADEEVEITIKTVVPERHETSESKKLLLDMINENRRSAPVIAHDVDIRSLIDDSQYPVE
jgi:hypothetical protein